MADEATCMHTRAEGPQAQAHRLVLGLGRPVRDRMGMAMTKTAVGTADEPEEPDRIKAALAAIRAAMERARSVVEK
jgi:hypothetical protein